MSISGGGLTVSGTFTGSSPVTFYVEIDAEGTPDTFKWRDGPSTYNATGVSCSNSPISLSYGLTIAFASTNGNSDGESWSWRSEPMSLDDTKDGVLLSKDGVHNLVAMTDGEIDVIDNITSPNGTSVTASRVTSNESAMTVHNKEVHIGHGKGVSSTWAGYVDNDQWGKKTEGFHVTDANVTNYAAVGYADYICGDGTNLFFGSYRGGIVFKTQIADPANITKNQRDFKDICGMIYDNSELWVLVCDSITSDNYTLHQVNTDDLTIEHSHVLILPTDAFVGADSTSSQVEDHTGVDYSSGGVIFSDMIITGDVIWFAAYKDSKVVEEVVLWNSDAPGVDASEDLTLTNRSPGIRKGTAMVGGRADEGWISIYQRTKSWGDSSNSNSYHVDSWYNTLYKKSLVRVDSTTVGWLCQYAPPKHVGNGIKRVLRVDVNCAEANTSSGIDSVGWGANTGWYGAGYDAGNFMNIIEHDHVAGSYGDDTAGLILLSNQIHGGSLSPLQTSSSGDGLFMCSNQETIERYISIGGQNVDTDSKWYSKHSDTVASSDINSSCKLGYYDTSSGTMYMMTADNFPTIDKIEYDSGWDDYTPDIIESVPLTLEIEAIGDGDDASELSEAIDSNDSQIQLEDVSGFAYGGSIIIGSEIITYTGRSADSRKLTGCKRGKFGTEAVSHSAGVTVEQARAKYFWKTSYTYLRLQHILPHPLGWVGARLILT